MKKGSFGEHLRREREMRGVSLEEISSATRISTRFLEALETERWERLPGGVFNRGFVRQVARFLGLDEEALIAEYALVTDDKPQVAVWADAPGKSKAVRRGPARWLVALLLLALAAGAWVAYQEVSPLVAAWRAPSAPAIPAPGDSAAPAPGETPGETSDAAAAGADEGVAAAEKIPLELKIEASQATTVTVVADGKTVFSGRLQANEVKRFRAETEFRISARNSMAVLVEMNGQTMPPLGPPGEPGNLTLTRKDLAKSAGGPN